MFISLIRAHYSIRVDTSIGASEKSESTGVADQQPKAEALTLLIQKRVPLRPIKVIERSDDVVVIHTKNRAKRKQNSRGRRRPSNQFRSKIRPSGSSRPSSSSSNFGGFKDFSSNDLRFPPFPTKPPRASNKLKFGSSKQRPSYDYNAQPARRPRPQQVVQTISTVYGPPATSFNQIDTQYGAPLTLQQAQNNAPSFSVHTIEPIQTNFFGPSGQGGGGGGNINNNNNNNNYNSQSYNNNNFGGNSNSNSGGNSYNNFAAQNEVTRYPTAQSISNFPLGDGSSFNVPKTSYGEPVRSASSPSTSSYQFNSIIGNQQPSNNRNHNNNPNNNNNNNIIASSANNFPKLPNRYDTSEFSTPTRPNPLNSNNYDFGNLDAISESKNVFSSVPSGGGQGVGSNQFQKNRFNKFNNFDYGFGKNYNDEEDDDDDDEEENFDFIYTTKRPRFSITTTSTTTPIPTTTKRMRKGVFGKRKRPTKVAQNHNLDTDDLRDAFSESSNNDFHEVALNSEDFLSFDSQRNVKKALGNNPIHEIHSTLKHARKNPALREALGEDFQIISVEKSLEQNPNNNFGGINFQRRGDEERINNEYREFSVGGGINFSGPQDKNMWNGDMNSFPRNHRFS